MTGHLRPYRRREDHRGQHAPLRFSGVLTQKNHVSVALGVWPARSHPTSFVVGPVHITRCQSLGIGDVERGERVRRVEGELQA